MTFFIKPTKSVSTHLGITFDNDFWQNLANCKTHTKSIHIPQHKTPYQLQQTTLITKITKITLTPGYVKLLKFLQDATVVGKYVNHFLFVISLSSLFFYFIFEISHSSHLRRLMVVGFVVPAWVWVWWWWVLWCRRGCGFDGGGFFGAGVGVGLMVVGFVVPAWVWV